MACSLLHANDSHAMTLQKLFRVYTIGKGKRLFIYYKCKHLLPLTMAARIDLVENRDVTPERVCEGKAYFSRLLNILLGIPFSQYEKPPFLSNDVN